MSFCFIRSGLNQQLELFKQSYQSYKHLKSHQSNSESVTETQLQKLRKKSIIKVAIIHNRAFWVHDNIFYTSKIIDGAIDNDNAEKIDAFSLSDNEIKLLLEILDNLNTH